MMRFKKLRTGIALVTLSTMMLAMPVSAKTNVNAKVDISNGGKIAPEIKSSKRNKRSYSQKVNGINFKLIINLEEGGKYTNEEQVEDVVKVFFQTYPQLYDRFGAYKSCATNIEIRFENKYKHEGVACAEQGGRVVYVSDEFLGKNPKHIDCIVHELGHIIQKGWDKNYMEDMNYEETFADYCRYIYAYNKGKINDSVWELQDVNHQTKRSNSVRFLVWLDYQLVSSNRDIIRDYYELCCDREYKKDKWHDKAWKNLFKGTKFDGMSIDDVWAKYKKSDFATYSSLATDGSGKSKLIKKTDVRQYLKDNGFSESYESKHK